MKTNYKKVEQYIIESMNADYIEECTGKDADTPKQLFEGLFECFYSEYGRFIQQGRGNCQEGLKEWLSGLPSAVDIAFFNCDVLEISKEWGMLPENPTEKQEDKILENYFGFMSMQYLKFSRRHGVEILKALN